MAIIATMSVATRSSFFSSLNLLSFGIALFILALLAGRLSLWDLDNAWAILPSTTSGLLSAMLLCILASTTGKFQFSNLRLQSLPFAFGLLLLFISDWLSRNYNLLQGPSIRGEILLCSGLAYLILKSGATWPWRIALPISGLMLSFVFLAESNGAPLTSDDNATFIYRLSLLKQNFPNIPFYYPLWNAGLDARDFFATGVLNIYSLTFPLLKFFAVDKVYNFIIVALLFILAPACTFAAAKLEKFSEPIPSLAGLLVLGGNLLWYRWALKYGTLGFITSASLMPLNLSLACRLLNKEAGQPSYPIIIISIISFTLMFFWSPSALAFLPLLALALLGIKSHFKQPRILLVAVALLLINLPWTALFWKISKVDSFLSAEAFTHQNLEIKENQNSRAFVAQVKERSKPFSFKRSLKILREAAVSANPVLFMLLLPGLCLLPRTIRLKYFLMICWLLVLGLVIPSLKPQLEFDRMLVVLFLIAALPAALCLERLIQNSRDSANVPARLLTALCLGFVMAAQFSTAAVAGNRSVEKFFFANADFQEMRQQISALPDDTRILFSGFVLHELNGSHLAPLSELTSKPLIASSPFHNLWKYRQIFPKEYLERGEQGIDQYLDTLNVGYVFAHEREWKDYFRTKPQKFQEMWAGKRFVLFKRLSYQGNYFLEGQGAVLQQSSNAVRLRVDSENAVLKFNYFPFLQSSACRLEPAIISASMTLLKLSNCRPGQEVIIRSISAWNRFWIERN